MRCRSMSAHHKLIFWRTAFRSECYCLSAHARHPAPLANNIYLKCTEDLVFRDLNGARRNGSPETAKPAGLGILRLEAGCAPTARLSSPTLRYRWTETAGLPVAQYRSYDPDDCTRFQNCAC